MYFASKCLSLLHSNSNYHIELVDLMKCFCVGCLCLQVRVREAKGIFVERRNSKGGGHLRETSKTSKVKDKRLVSISPFTIQFHIRFELGKFDRLSFHLSRIMRKRSEEINFSKRV